MKGEIIKIDQPKESRNKDVAFRRVYFKMEDGSWAKTDLCSSYRNWARWKDLLVIGNALENLIMKDKDTVNADSFPKKIMNEEDKLKEFSQQFL